MKALFAVVFTPDAPIELFCTVMATVTLRGGHEVKAMNCTEFAETSMGLYRLVPKESNGRPPIALWVRPQDVLFVMQAERPSDFGFLPASQ